MKGYKHYVPIIKSKQAELEAVRGLSSITKQNITPLLELIPVAWDFQKEAPKMSLKEHLDKSAGKIKKAWGCDLRFFMDLYLLNIAGTFAGHHPLEYFFNELAKYELDVIPVIGLTQTHDYQQAVSNIAHKNKKRVCLRIRKEDIDDMLELALAIEKTLNALKINAFDCDLVLDLENLPSKIPDDFVESLLDAIEYFPFLKDWCSFTLASSSFPLVLEVQQNNDKLMPRNDLLLWQTLIKADIPRLPSFGDYAIQHPELSDLDFRFIKSSVNLRYATDKAWLVFKGREKVRHGYEQFNDICRLLVKRKEYYGSEYSWGDGYIERCANNEDGPGNATTWRKVAFSHHITLTVEQVTT